MFQGRMLDKLNEYSHKKRHLLYLFFEKSSITATLQLGDGPAVEAVIGDLSPYAVELWENRYPCGKKGGGWIHYQIGEEQQLSDVYRLVQAKCPAPKRR